MSVDDLDLSGAARAAAVLTRHRLVTLAEEITAETDPARIRDISIGLAALVEELDEVLHELATAVDDTGRLLLARELCDLLYVTYGVAVAAGLNLAPAWDEVHAANLRKLDARRYGPDEKIGRPAGWRPPHMRRRAAEVLLPITGGAE